MNKDMDYLDNFNDIIHKYVPPIGEGDTKASQIATAVNKLIFKWWNDGDVYDNVRGHLSGWCNDLSSYANWLFIHTNADVRNILLSIENCYTEDNYTELLCILGDELLTEEVLTAAANEPKVESIYKCRGPFRFEEEEDDRYESGWY